MENNTKYAARVRDGKQYQVCSQCQGWKTIPSMQPVSGMDNNTKYAVSQKLLLDDKRRCQDIISTLLKTQSNITETNCWHAIKDIFIA